MARRILVSAFVMGVLGCSASADGGAQDESDARADGGASAVDSGGLSPYDGSVPAVDSGRPGSDAPSGDAGSTCVPKAGVDVPDDAFEDTNCDGIDGDKSTAIFVAPSGVDGAAGTMGAPLKSVREATALAAKEKKAVYLCNATYTESIVISGEAVNLFGGYDCTAGWKRTYDRAVIAPPSGVALSVRDVAGDMTVDRIELRAADATTPGSSSIAVVARNAAQLTVRNAVIDGGRGADAAPPDLATAWTSSASAGKDGETLPSVECTYHTLNVSACLRGGNGGSPPIGYPGSTSCEGQGGAGGKGGHAEMGYPYAAPLPGQAGQPTALGGISMGKGLPGIDGKPGAPGVPGTSSTLGFGTISDDGYIASNAGTDGGSGGTGGGGSGGAGGLGMAKEGGSFPDHFFSGGGGGAGGNGGCGGNGGHGGSGGGASIALLSRKSHVALIKTTITTHAGGRGAASGVGGEGQGPGVGGMPGWGTWAISDAHGFMGGNGSSGGKGGPGGAGGGGPSVAILFTDDKPTTEAVTIAVGSGGKGGRALGGADGADGNVCETFDPTVPSSCGAASTKGDAP